MRFEKKKFSTVDLGGSNVFRSGSKSLKKLLEDIPIAHLRLKYYWNKHGTWPVPPIILNVSNSTVPPVFQQPLQSPYHLLEGYHRMALAIEADRQNNSPASHEFWIARVIAPSS